MSDLLILLGGVWAIGAMCVAIGSFIGYGDAVSDRKGYPTLYGTDQTERRKRKHARRFFTAYAWPVWSARWVARALADMQATAFGPQGKDSK